MTIIVASFLQGQQAMKQMAIDGLCEISQERNSSRITVVYRNNARFDVCLLRCDAVLSGRN